MTNVEPLWSEDALVLQVDSVARHVRLAAGGDFMANNDGAGRSVEIPRYYFAPEAADSINRAVARFPRFPRRDQTVDGYTAEFNLLRRKAESYKANRRGVSTCYEAVYCGILTATKLSPRRKAESSDCGMLQNFELQRCRWAQVSPRPLFPSCACRTRRCRARRSLWR